MSTKKMILWLFIVIGFSVLGAEIYFYFFDFEYLLKDRVFPFKTPEYINYWLLTYVSFSILLRTFGLIRFSFNNKQGYREYNFGQLMLVALLCKEFFRYAFYIYIKEAIESGNWETLSKFLLLFSIEIGLLIYFYFESIKMSTK